MGSRTGVCRDAIWTLEQLREGHSHDAAEHGERETEIKGDRSHTQSGDEAAKEPHGRVRQRVNKLHEHEREALRPPRTVDAANEIDDESAPQHKEIQEENKVQKVSEKGHARY